MDSEYRDVKMTEHRYDDGGPAKNKTLLDEFAGHIAAALLAPQHLDFIKDLAAEREDIDSCRVVAGIAYDYAAAMIAEKRRCETAGTGE